MTIAVKRPRRACAFIVLIASAASANGAVLHLANWNMGNLPNAPADQTNLATVFGYMGSIGGGPLDVLAMIETDTTSAVDTTNVAKSAFGTQNYTSLVTAADGGGDRTGFVYNTSTLQLVNSTTVTGITHPSLRAQFRPVGTTGAEDFYYYAVHLQSGSTTAIKNQRVAQAQLLRADADALGTANVIFGGDFNWQKADDVSAGVGAYRTFSASGNGQVSDPINKVGDWRDNAAYKQWHTNDPGANMDDRFDMQLISGELTDGVGLEYVADSYGVVGNNGTHALGGTILTGTGAPPNVLTALYNFSDHLPVMASYSFSVPEPGSLLVVACGLLLTRRRRSA